jgi:hypothetical protein
MFCFSLGCCHCTVRKHHICDLVIPRSAVYSQTSFQHYKVLLYTLYQISGILVKWEF